ncbi:ethanolamine utilization protein, EutP [[Clostridium] methylpentosum DSM 5476]|jgi:ethanolamine utilization protein EutP|uniref:Ethanolamine utilization protein, EutP n=1 Tax=[Clostridium] methylpentosum DSM 5476 TaxID=537013 RepID=C0EHN9_9FIRM|nr:ethanolamine utilization protein, EutP [[Clostridium] methylpentosum DSM 5476]MDY3988743.1 EutP/PduV family microcompartment system protein [Massilioclostridium sp.]MEE1491034.1 EutP/PduV family microcompartment system protein [Massilioclostridium sp.]
MKKFMLIGAVSAGKTSFSQAIHDQDITYKKTQAVDFLDNIIDTPGEYLERRIMYRSLGITAADTDLIVLVQSCVDDRCIFAPGFSSMFAKPVVGIVTKIDLTDDKRLIERARQRLRLAGCKEIFEVSNTERTGVEEFKQFVGYDSKDS